MNGCAIQHSFRHQSSGSKGLGPRRYTCVGARNCPIDCRAVDGDRINRNDQEVSPMGIRPRRLRGARVAGTRLRDGGGIVCESQGIGEGDYLGS